MNYHVTPGLIEACIGGIIAWCFVRLWIDLVIAMHRVNRFARNLRGPTLRYSVECKCGQGWASAGSPSRVMSESIEWLAEHQERYHG